MNFIKKIFFICILVTPLTAIAGCWPWCNYGSKDEYTDYSEAPTKEDRSSNVEEEEDEFGDTNISNVEDVEDDKDDKDDKDDISKNGDDS